ncbi:hypothetical protein TBC1_12180 [Lentimicrobium saccharophilum]|uniref:Uncharacterized protein n=1 Tax=Lentimicrobium saccharophilum TaxID=1678841 RepID=A0A0S7C5F9_9BACT|nr:hypothetical protein [Lentimicrobium saccharophilum]GAP44376.1 hypothetical protein TBC1_12180 [Lentimicrobium saccharophilum]
MKALVFVFLIIFYSGMNGIAQNRIQGWNTEKITSIQVELTSPDSETEIYIFNTKQDIDTIISFLKNIDFRELNGNSIDAEVQKNNWKCKIVFQGQRDQVYLYKKSGCVGKTSFLIDDNVIENFRIMVEELLSKAQ